MSRKGHAYRKAREQRKALAKRRQEELKRANAKPSGIKVLRDLRELFDEDAAEAVNLALRSGLSEEEIAARLKVDHSKVRTLLDLAGSLPRSISDLLLSHPQLLRKPEAFEAILAGVRGGGLHPR